jgi:hypothetical protein
MSELTSVADAPAAAAPVPQPENACPVHRPYLEDLTDEMLAWNSAAAQEQGVEPAVHPRDYMYWYCAAHPAHSTERGIQYYFWDGGRTAAQLAEILTELGYEQDQPIKLLEFASGYGCVSRHLKKNPRYGLVSCDIHPAAMELVRTELGIQTLLSAQVPEEFSPGEKFDVVFALSFFTHMPKGTFGRWLSVLFDSLKVPGHLIFTTHSLKSAPGLDVKPEDIPADGFWFRADSEQRDLDTHEYGLSLTLPEFVIGETFRRTGAPLVMYKHAHWWRNQDVWVVKREK